MVNWFDDIRSQLHFKQFQIGDLLFAEYTCPIQQKSVGIWSDHDCVVHVLSGKKIWRADNGEWIGESGQTLFFRKGCYTVEQFFDEDFCLLCFTVPDDFIRDIVVELGEGVKVRKEQPLWRESGLRLKPDVAIAGYLQSMIAYFSQEDEPSEIILRLKLRELVTSIVLSDKNPELAAHFLETAAQDGPSIRRVMEANFRYNLSLEEFARMCHRSLSSFKRDFGQAMGESPGRWLLKRRLEHAASLLIATDRAVTEIAYDCGFEDTSHFSKRFKEYHGVTASGYRERNGQ